MDQQTAARLAERINVLEEALAEYAQFYGLTPRARAVFSDHDFASAIARRVAKTAAMSATMQPQCPAEPSDPSPRLVDPGEAPAV